MLPLGQRPSPTARFPLAWLLGLWLWAPPALGAAQAPAAPPQAPAPAAPQAGPGNYPNAAQPIDRQIEAELLAARPAVPPDVLYEVLEVVDGDTLHIRMDGQRVKLRLVCVDTEEKFSNRGQPDPTKPETVFGQASAEWAKAYFPARASVEGKPQIGLVYPDGVARYDVYGRLLCHALLPDGLDFNLLLVRLGISPYFNKYGNSELAHAEFQAAQALARAERRGIWNPATNVSADPARPSAVRPYSDLLPWWDARAAAIDRFRAERARDGLGVVACDEPESLVLCAAACAEGRTARVFGTIYQVFREDNGDRTLLLRSGVRERAVRVVIPAARLADFDVADLERRAGEAFTQNYLFFRGRLETRGQSFRLLLDSPEQVEVAGPEPVANPALVPGSEAKDKPEEGTAQPRGSAPR
jgi:endonuclease YncB( thermonuclease family)